MSAAIGWDDLWLGVICQSCLEIAGSPRKVFRHRGVQKLSGGRALIGMPRETEVSQPNSELQNGRTLNSRMGLSSCDERETTQTLS